MPETAPVKGARVHAPPTAQQLQFIVCYERCLPQWVSGFPLDFK